MANYRYIARDFAGMQIQGVLTGASELEVLEWLRERDYTPISIEPINQKAKKPWSARYRRIRSEDMSSLCWQLHTMIQGGVPITEALDTIAEDIDNFRLQDVLKEVSDTMKTGESFHESLERHPKVFSDLFCSMIRSGEIGGTLTSVLKRSADFYDQRDELQRKVKRAVTYPAFVIGFIILIIIAMMVFVIPRFESIFESFGNRLPAFTRAFMGFYHFTVDHLPIILISLVGGALGLIAFAKTPAGQRLVAWLSLKLPVIGKLYRYAFLATYGQTISTLLSSGVSVLEAHDIVESMTGNNIIKKSIQKTKAQIAEGVGIAMSMTGTKLFPRLLTRMVQVGEDSGSLPNVLDRTSTYYEKKVDMAVGTLVAILEPALIIVVGGIVLLVLLALYLPVFSMSNIQG